MKFKDPNMCQVEAIKAMSDYPNITGDFTNVNTQVIQRNMFEEKVTNTLLSRLILWQF